MKILLDQNISFRLAQRIVAAFPKVEHVKSLDLTMDSYDDSKSSDRSANHNFNLYP